MAIEKKGEEWEEYNNAVKWMALTIIFTLLATVILVVVSLPLGHLLMKGISQQSLDTAWRFLLYIIQYPDYLLTSYGQWFSRLNSHNSGFSLGLWLPILPFFVLPTGIIVGILSNPYRFQSNIHGSARLAELSDIKKMGLLNGFCIVIGKFKGHLLKMPETLSCLCCAPPGTGKTVGVVKPTIFNSDGMSMIINDPKPELCYDTSGARAKVGPVFIINWGAEDVPSEGI